MKRKTKLRREKKFKYLYKFLMKNVFERANKFEERIKLIEQYNKEFRAMYRYCTYRYDFELCKLSDFRDLEQLEGKIDYVSDRFGCLHRLYLLIYAPEFYKALKNPNHCIDCGIEFEDPKTLFLDVEDPDLREDLQKEFANCYRCSDCCVTRLESIVGRKLFNKVKNGYEQIKRSRLTYH
jgi:hypothetical protein